MKEEKNVKRGRPHTTKVPRVTTTVALSLQNGSIESLMEAYSTTRKSEAIRLCIYEKLGVSEERVEHKDSNVTRRSRASTSDVSPDSSDS